MGTATGSLGDKQAAYHASLEYVAWELIPDPFTDSAMEMEPFRAAHRVARTGAKRLYVHSQRVRVLRAPARVTHK